MLSVQVVKPLSQDLARVAANLRRQPFNGGFVNNQSAGGTDLLIVVRIPDRTIISAGQDALNVTTFIDDKFNDLTKSKRERRDNVYYPPSQGLANVSEDWHACVFSFSSEQVPAPDATRILARGLATVRTSRG